MPRTTEKSTRRPANRKEQIALTAAELFCVRGYHHVGIDDIADAVGITGPALYRHFRGKQALLAGATRTLTDALVATATEAAATEGTARERLDATLIALIELSWQRRTAARLYQWEGRYLADDERAEVAARTARVLRVLRDLVLETQPRREKREASLLASAVASVIGSPSTHRVSLPRAKAHALLLSCCHDLLAVRDLPPPARRASTPAATPGVLPRREVLLAEAIRLFHRHGYHEVSVEDIGAAAGINSSSVYRHFPSKADLLAAVYHRATARVEVATSDALGAGGTPAEALGRLVRSYVGLTYSHADLAAVYVSENDNLPAADLHALRGAQRRHIDTWVRLTARPGESVAQTRFRVHAALNVVTDLARVRRPGVGPEHTERLVRALLQH
ncbi:TetR/AcrR family transcriptional regulator [Amycolatopsis sp. CA-230715]|uniref:TetR/AcrR family transcriptional regulator n=1 Tax=Amycolatopsis sp. CA-230715 TaxID=2745196 RepID=UPI001C0343EA|nr:TetR/AcrR family transcriptional regulator [Amycolatopsis sp. CA-230715]QWF82669.1 Transcriptional repressor Mce3R [Amycolatopsis sp. CA-230715]